MKLGHQNCFALIIHKGNAEIVRVRKDRGVGHSLFRGDDYLLSVEEYEENLDLHTWGNGHYIESAHIVATAARIDQLPPAATLALPDRSEIDGALPAVQAEIEASRLSPQMKDYLKLLLAHQNRYTIAYPFAAHAVDGGHALKLAVQKLTSWEAALFAGIEERVRETISLPDGSDRGRPTSDFAARVRDVVSSPVPVATSAETLLADPSEVQGQCKADLQKVLSDTMAKIAEIDRRLINSGDVPAWRDTMNEVFETAMQASRTLDYVPDDPRPIRRRDR